MLGENIFFKSVAAFGVGGETPTAVHVLGLMVKANSCPCPRPDGEGQRKHCEGQGPSLLGSFIAFGVGGETPKLP